MELGERLRQERIAQGLSQRQLAGEKITRNMLSQIENGSATPSVDTLRYLAQQLHKPVSFFLEGGSSLPGFEKVWEAFRAGDAQQALNQLDALPEEANGWEYDLLRALALLSAAEQYKIGRAHV